MTVIEELLTLDEDALARVWCDFNRYIWPRDISTELRPNWWKPMGKHSERERGYVAPFMEFVDAKISDERIHEEWLRAVDLA